MKLSTVPEALRYIGQAFEEEPEKRTDGQQQLADSGICDALDKLECRRHLVRGCTLGGDVWLDARRAMRRFHYQHGFWFPAKCTDTEPLYPERWTREYDIYRAIACYLMAAMVEAGDL